MRSSRTVRNLPQAVSAPVGGHNAGGMWYVLGAPDQEGRRQQVPGLSRGGRRSVSKGSWVEAVPSSDRFPVYESLRPHVDEPGCLGDMARRLHRGRGVSTQIGASCEELDGLISTAGDAVCAKAAFAMRIPGGDMWLETSRGRRKFGLFVQTTREALWMRRVDAGREGHPPACSPFSLFRLALIDPPVVDWRAVARGRAATTADEDAEWLEILVRASRFAQHGPCANKQSAQNYREQYANDLVTAAVAVSPLYLANIPDAVRSAMMAAAG